jgi:hypothetical protein
MNKDKKYLDLNKKFVLTSSHAVIEDEDGEGLNYIQKAKKDDKEYAKPSFIDIHGDAINIIHDTIKTQLNLFSTILADNDSGMYYEDLKLILEKKLINKLQNG